MLQHAHVFFIISLAFFSGYHERCWCLIASLVHVRSADLLLLFRCRCKSLNKNCCASVRDSWELGVGFLSWTKELIWSAGPTALNHTDKCCYLNLPLFFSIQNPYNSHTSSHTHSRIHTLETRFIHKQYDFHLWVMSIVCIRRDPLRIFSPTGDIVLPAVLLCPSAASWDDSR